MLDERVLGVLARLEAEDAAEREAGLPASQRSRQVEATTGRFLFALAASQAGIEVLGDRRLAWVLVDLARGGSAGARRPSRLARARPGQVRGLASKHRRRGSRRTGRSSSKATLCGRWRRPKIRSTSSSSTPRRTTTRRCSASRDRCSSRAVSWSPTTSSRTRRRSARTRRHARPIRRCRASPCRSIAGSSCPSCLWLPDLGHQAWTANNLDPSSIRSRCVCWHYRGKEVVRLE